MSQQDRALLAWPGSPYLTEADLQQQVRALEQIGLDVHTTREPVEDLAGIAILVTSSKVRLSHETIATADSLRLVLTATSGHEHLDVSALEARGALVARCPVSRRDAVIDTTIAMAFSFWRGLPGLDAAARDDRWARGELPDLGMRTVRDRTVGILGHGVIGEQAARIWASLGARVLVHDPQLPGDASSPLERICAEADLLTLHCSLTPSSERVVDADLLARLRPGTILLNTARGECLDEAALPAATHLGGIGLDVFDVEPWRTGPPPMPAGVPVHLLPHAAGYHASLGRALTLEIADAVLQFLTTGTPPHPV